jgi:hypothetical protein
VSCPIDLYAVRVDGVARAFRIIGLADRDFTPRFGREFRIAKAQRVARCDPTKCAIRWLAGQLNLPEFGIVCADYDFRTRD